MQPNLIRLREVQRLTGKSRSRIYDDWRSGTFPRPVWIGRRAVAWVEAEVEAWVAAQIKSRTPPPGKATP